MKKTKKYFPNNWEKYKQRPDDFFQSIDFLDFMIWKCEGWELPSYVCCLIREEDCANGKVKVREHVYQKAHAAKNKIKQLFSQPHTTCMVVTHNHETCINSDEIIDETTYN